MRAITVWQPWATGMALLLKMIETRHWYTDYRGPLVIHAAKRWTREQREFWDRAKALNNHRLMPYTPPLGALICVTNLVQCVRIEDPVLYSMQERFWGKYDPARFAWMCADTVAFPEPIPYKGRQGWFNVPDSVLPPGWPRARAEPRRF